MLVSVIVTAHNTGAFVGQCLQSVLASTHEELDVVAIDDGSVDDTLETLNAIAQIDDRVRVSSGPHVGRNAALRSGHAMALGDVHCWVDSDDVVAPTGIERCVSRIDSEHELVFSHRDRIDSSGRPLGPDPRNRIPYSPRRLLVDNMIFHLRVFTKDLYERSGGVGDLSSAIDWDMNLRMCESTTPVCVPQSLYGYRIRSGRMSAGPSQSLNARLAVQRAIARRQLPYELVVAGSGWHIRKAGR